MCPEFRPRDRGNLVGMGEQTVRVRRPVCLHGARELRDGIDFDTNAWDALFLALNDGRARAAEWIEHA